jgi:hypothetical protein
MWIKVGYHIQQIFRAKKLISIITLNECIHVEIVKIRSKMKMAAFWVVAL